MDAVDLDHHVAGAGEDVDSFVRVVDRFVLFEPFTDALITTAGGTVRPSRNSAMLCVPISTAPLATEITSVRKVLTVNKDIETRLDA